MWKELMPLWSNNVGLVQPLPRLRELYVKNCQKLEYLVAEEVKEQPQQGTSSTCNGMEYLPKAVVYNNTCLERIEIVGCDSLTHIAVGQLPPTLKVLNVEHCKNMQILLDGDDTINCSSSNSLLEDLRIESCPSLKSLTSSGELPATLQSLYVYECNMLESVAKSFPHNSSLETSGIWNCENLKSLPMGIHNITSLQVLSISKCPGIVSFPKEGFPTNLTSLAITDCNIIESLLEWGLHKLTSLQHLQIEGGCPDLESFPEMMLPASLTSLHIRNFQNLKYLSSKGFRYLSSLKTLRIGWCEKLMSFPDDGLPPSLLDLRIVCCEKLTSFTEDGLPPSLQQLQIANCPLLKERCKKDQGRAWIKIAHIPCVEIDCKFIYDPEPEEENRLMDENRLRLFGVFYSNF